MTIQILKINGTDKNLYPLIGPLVMDPVALKYNNRYPFKTNKNFKWYIAVNEANGEAVGFIPLEYKSHEILINNYYVQSEGHDEILSWLIEAVWRDMTKDMPPYSRSKDSPQLKNGSFTLKCKKLNEERTAYK